MFICVLTELSINSEKNNKRSQLKKIKQPHLRKHSISDTPNDQNIHFCFLLFGLCVGPPPRTYIQKINTQTFATEEPNVINEMSLFGIIEISLIV